jgi:hypothetical protein
MCPPPKAFSRTLDRSLPKADGTLRTSQAVPHPSTDRALRRLTSEVRRDPVYSTRYGRQRITCASNLLGTTPSSPPTWGHGVARARTASPRITKGRHKTKATRAGIFLCPPPPPHPHPINLSPLPSIKEKHQQPHMYCQQAQAQRKTKEVFRGRELNPGHLRDGQIY